MHGLNMPKGDCQDVSTGRIGEGTFFHDPHGSCFLLQVTDDFITEEN